ncbi:hypothetical protein CK203_040725 [Vitis vinifera]|uniref:Uncharacterized protein n=1 Tax=Vitis vinifera TaxID=29760 RepID=A0A438HF41_VITVI|nr:hypothetical protein CK203_040725 [Vitis vinifera]
MFSNIYTNSDQAKVVIQFHGRASRKERRNVGEKEGGQPSRNSGQTGLEPEEHMIDSVEISPRVKNWIESLKNAEKSTQSQSSWPRIPKVPQLLRGTRDFKKVYEPRVISIGPYHHGKPHLQPVETIKLQCAGEFLADSGQDIEALYTKIGSNIEALRKCYDKIPTDDEKLTWMMLLDGCFLLQFIRSRKDGSTVDLNDKKFRHSHRKSTTVIRKRLDERSHLLDLLRSAILGKSAPKQERQPDKKGKSSSSSGGDGRFCCPWKKGKQQGIRQPFRNIKELKAAGIHLRKNAPNDYTVTSYLRFLYELIDHADDVKELRSRHILINHLGSDEDVARIFNEIANDVVDTEVYGDVKARIQKDYNKRVNTCIAAIDGLLHETCGEQLTTAIVVVGAPDMLSGGTGEWILACREEKKRKKRGKREK